MLEGVLTDIRNCVLPLDNPTILFEAPSQAGAP